MKVKIGNPAPVSAGKVNRENRKSCKYYVTVRGNKFFYGSERQLMQEAIAGCC